MKLQPGGITGSPEVLASQLRAVEPETTHFTNFDLADLVEAVAAVQVRAVHHQ